MKKLTLKNYFLLDLPNENEEQAVQSLQLWLSKLLLHGKDSRARTRFMKLIGERAKELEDERLRLAEDYAEKKKGEIVYLTKDGKKTTKKGDAVSISIKETKKFNEEWLKYLNEDFVLDVSPETQDTIYGVRDVILNTNEEFIGQMAFRYDEWCDSFEKIAENKKDENKDN